MFSHSSGKAKSGKRGRSKRSTKSAGSDDLHDFIHDIEFSAKKILKQHMQKRLTEATIEKRERRRHATGLSSSMAQRGGQSSNMGMSQSLGSLHGKTGMGTGNMTGTGFSGGFTQTGMAMPSPDMPGSASMYGGPQTDGPGAFGSTQHTLGGTMGSSMSSGVPMQTLPSIGSRSMSASLLSGTGGASGGVMGSSSMDMSLSSTDGSSSLPRLGASVSGAATGATTGTMRGSPGRKKRLTAKDRAKLKASPFARTRRSIDEEEAIEARANVKTDKSVGMTGGKMLKEAAKLAGATIKGDVHALSMLRADHAVDRKMSAQAWADPNSKTGVEKGMSTLGLVLDRAHELQGPTGWSSDDLRRKYRDEKERLAAYEAGLAAKREAERLEREQNVIRPFVLIPMHPLHMYYVQMCGAENEKSRRRARSRNQLKSFSLDLITLWHANRPEGEGIEDGGLAGQIARVKGLVGRRPGHAIKAFNAQVQSVSIERAMQGSMSSRELHLMGAFGDQSKGTNGGGGSLEGYVTLAEKDAADAEATRQRRMMWQRPWHRSVAQVPILEEPPQTVEELLNMLWKRDEARLRRKIPKAWSVPSEPSTRDDLKEENNLKEDDESSSLDFAPTRISIFRRGRGEARRLVYHVHDVEETTASSMQIDEKDADELLREMARGVVKRQNADEEAAFAKFKLHAQSVIREEEERWKSRLARREVATKELSERRQAEMSDASKSDFVTAAEYGCSIQGKYVLMTVEVAVSALTGCVPAAACVRMNAYDPLDCSTTSIDVLGVDLLKMLSVDIKNDNRYPGVPPKLGSTEEQEQWESHQEMFTMYVDEESEDLRVRACHWVYGEDAKSHDDLTATSKSLRCTYNDVSDYNSLPLTERMRLAKLARAFWCDFYGRLPVWKAVVHRLSWDREVDPDTGKTIPGSVSLVYDCPPSIGLPRFEKETTDHEQKMRNLINKLAEQEAVMIEKREKLEDHIREAAEKILTPVFKQQGLLRLVTLIPAPEFDDDDVDNPAAQWAEQLVATLIGEGYIGEGQSSVRGRDEAEEWAAAQEAAREEARLKLANDTLSYMVCGEHGRFGKVPGISIAGYMDVVTLDFRRDAERSSTNSVLVTVCTALENALLCPMLGGYDTIVEVADSAPEEPVGGPITTLVPPSSCRQATTTLNKRLPHTCIIFNDSEAPLDHFVEANYKGHRRNEPPRHSVRGFARYSLQRLLVPDPHVPPNSFGVTERAAVANSAGCWPRRHTWHSEEVANGNLSRVRRQSDYAYVSERKFASGSNDPNIYVAHMDTYKVGQLEMRKLR